MSSEQQSILRSYAYFYLRFRPRTVSEMTQYLEKKAKQFKIEKGVVKEVVNGLIVLKMLDDHEFISWFVERKASSKKKSDYVIRAELMKHGIKQTDLEGYDMSDHVDTKERAFNALRPRWKQYKKYEALKAKTSAWQYLQRKGFSYEDIAFAIDKAKREE